MKQLIGFILLFFCLVNSSLAAQSITGEAAYEYAHLSNQIMNHNDELIRSRPSVLINILKPLSETPKKPSLFNIESSFYGYANFKEGEKGETEFRRLVLNYKGDQNVFNLGLQNINWSETFGVNIMDIVNPRDYSFFIFDDLNMSKIPVGVVNYQYFFDNFSLQLIYNPNPKFDELPVQGSLFDPYAKYNLPIDNPSQPEAFSDSEYGGKVRYLFDGGLDLSFIYYSHFNRNPVLYLDSSLSRLNTQYERVDSFGQTFSYVIGEIVLRGDYLYTQNSPYATRDLTLDYEDRHQAILGGDYSTSDGFTVGVQLHADTLVDNQWMSAQLKNSFFSETLRPSIMVFSGIDNPDLWIRGDLNYYYTSNFQVTPEYNYLSGKSSEGILGEFGGHDYYQLLVKYLF